MYAQQCLRLMDTHVYCYSASLATQSQLPITLPDNVLASALSELTSFLRKANRLLRGASLAALEALAGKYGDGFETSGGSYIA